MTPAKLAVILYSRMPDFDFTQGPGKGTGAYHAVTHLADDLTQGDSELALLTLASLFELSSKFQNAATMVALDLDHIPSREFSESGMEFAYDIRAFMEAKKQHNRNRVC